MYAGREPAGSEAYSDRREIAGQLEIARIEGPMQSGLWHLFNRPVLPHRHQSSSNLNRYLIILFMKRTERRYGNTSACAEADRVIPAIDNVETAIAVRRYALRVEEPRRGADAIC